MRKLLYIKLRSQNVVQCSRDGKLSEIELDVNSDTAHISEH